MKKVSELSRLENIGPTIEKRLNEIGVYTRSDLERIGPAKAYQCAETIQTKRSPCVTTSTRCRAR